MPSDYFLRFRVDELRIYPDASFVKHSSHSAFQRGSRKQHHSRLCLHYELFFFLERRRAGHGLPLILKEASALDDQQELWVDEE
jgi:hypothetical protein